MADGSAEQRFGAIGVGAAACIACCTPPIVGFLAAASIGTLFAVALFGAVGLSVAAIVLVAYLRRRGARTGVVRNEARPVRVALGRKLDA